MTIPPKPSLSRSRYLNNLLRETHCDRVDPHRNRIAGHDAGSPCLDRTSEWDEVSFKAVPWVNLKPAIRIVRIEAIFHGAVAGEMLRNRHHAFAAKSFTLKAMNKRCGQLRIQFRILSKCASNATPTRLSCHISLRRKRDAKAYCFVFFPSIPRELLDNCGVSDSAKAQLFGPLRKNRYHSSECSGVALVNCADQS